MYGNSSFNQSNDSPGQVPVVLTPEEKTAVRGSINDIRVLTESLLPGEYDVAMDVEQTASGPAYSVVVFPPFGNGISVQINVQEFAETTPSGPEVDIEDLDLDEEECEEVAHQLVASTVLQCRQAEDDATELPAS